MLKKKNKKTIFKKYRKIDTLDVEIVRDFIDKVLIGHYDKANNSRNIKVIWNFSIKYIKKIKTIKQLVQLDLVFLEVLVLLVGLLDL